MTIDSKDKQRRIKFNMGVCNSRDTIPSLEANVDEQKVTKVPLDDDIRDVKKPSLIISIAPEDQRVPESLSANWQIRHSRNGSGTGPLVATSRERIGIQPNDSPDNEGNSLLLVPRQSVLKSITRYGTGSEITAQGSAESELYSKKSCVRFIEGDIAVQDLEESKRMNKISSKCDEVLKGLKELKPELIREIHGHYDPSIPITGPWFHNITQSTYSGQCRSMTPHGWGRLITKKGEVIDAYFQNGMIMYFAQIIFSDGTWYKGGFDKKLKNGPGKYVDKFGLSTKCTWVNGEAAGPTIIKDQNNRVLFEGTILKGMREGPGIFYDRVNRFEYRGNFLNDQFQGYGRKEYENGIVYEGNFTAGLETGEGEIRLIDGRIYKGPFASGKPHGAGILITDYGVVRPIRYHNGQLIRQI